MTRSISLKIKRFSSWQLFNYINPLLSNCFSSCRSINGYLQIVREADKTRKRGIFGIDKHPIHGGRGRGRGGQREWGKTPNHFLLRKPGLALTRWATQLEYRRYLTIHFMPRKPGLALTRQASRLECRHYLTIHWFILLLILMFQMLYGSFYAWMKEDC